MRFKLRSLFVVVLLAAIATPISMRIYRHFYPRPFFVGPTVYLCGIKGTDYITQLHVENLLASHGINSATEGSKIYGTIVEKSRLQEAIELLEESTADGLPTIKLKRDGEGQLWVLADQSHVFAEQFDLDIGDMVDSEDRHANLVFAIKRNSGSELTKGELNFVKSLSGWERKYLNRDGMMKTGYEVVLTLENQPEDADVSCVEVYEIMNDNKEIEFLGGSKGISHPPK